MNQAIKGMLEKYNKKSEKLESLKAKKMDLDNKIKALEVELIEYKLKVIEKASSEMSLEDIVNTLHPETGIQPQTEVDTYIDNEISNVDSEETTYDSLEGNTFNFGEVDYENNVNL